MRHEFNLQQQRLRSLVLVTSLAALVAGCSRDTARYDDNPTSNPFRSRNDVSQAPSGGGYTPSRVETQPLPPPQAQYPSQGQGYSTSPYQTSPYQQQSAYPSSPPPPYRPQSEYQQPQQYAAAPRSVPAAPAPAYTPGPAPYNPPAHTATAQPKHDTGWRWEGGTAVTLQPGETVDVIARRYGVPAQAILRANNLADASRVQPGTRLVIPSYQASNQQPAGSPPAPLGQTKASAPLAPRASAPAAGSQVHVVNPGDTLFSLARRYNVSHADIARANGLDAYSQLKVGQRVTIPGAAQARAPQPMQRVEAPKQQPQQMAQNTPAPTAPQNISKATEVVDDEKDTGGLGPSIGGSPQFRKPVTGRVISGFGPKPNGQHNDGINIAVPEGTEVKAAEGGTVAYAGNELKGYGNLVLIRHSDGWMTAYAHNSSVVVKRGETVKRGQTIARAGQSGGVPTPQVHFEIRKGSTPVDPTKYLSAL
jgi:murein DD-endopeptidase MepM/ murein hydrolase activator NlpD